MLSQRSAAYEPLANAGAIPALLQLLDPLQSPAAVDNAAKALGNLSADLAARCLIRNGGGVGAFVRMLKDDCPDTMQVSGDCQVSAMKHHATARVWATIQVPEYWCMPTDIQFCQLPIPTGLQFVNLANCC